MKNNIKNIVEEVITAIKRVKSIKQVEKDWGQMHFSPLPVKYPCVLVDVASVSLSSVARGGEIVELELSVTVIMQSLRQVSEKERFECFDLIAALHNELQCLGGGKSGFSPLIRQSLRKAYVNNASQVYTIAYITTFKS